MFLKRYQPNSHQLRREMSDLFDNVFQAWPFERTGGSTFPALNIWEDAESFHAEADLPGVDPKDVDIQVEGNVLTLRGEKKNETEDQGKNYHFVERVYGTFQRTVQLPSNVDPEKVAASYKNGVLTVTIAKKPEAKSRKIEIRSE
jgi:HSP20 family protein